MSETHKKIDYTFKAVVIRTGWDKVERDLSYKCFKNCDYKEYMEMTAKMSNEGNIKVWQEAHKINKATYERRKRLSKRIESFLIDQETGEKRDCNFLTLTFTDEKLASTTPEYRRKLVQRYLKAQNAPYVANIDFGKINGREHYHALIQSININYKEWQKNGAIKGEVIKVSSDSNALARYIAKMTNHALKETTKRQALLYSR